MKRVDLQPPLRQLLARRGPIGAPPAIRELGISQAQFSRLVRSLRQEILTTGKARSTRYALKRSVRELRSPLPIYMIDASGAAVPLAELTPTGIRGTYIHSMHPSVRSAHYPDIPYWMDDLRPSGFLGRLIPRRQPELGYPQDVQLWSADDCLHYWAVLGWDLIGNLVIGERAYELYIRSLTDTSQSISNAKRVGQYPELAEQIMRLGAVGSSAGGEQPKFLARRNSDKAGSASEVLVKFSPLGDGAVPQRRRELLVCEHLALSTLTQAGVAAAKSELVEAAGRMFLELARFDRTSNGGRHGLISLHALDAEHVGAGGTWREIAAQLLERGVISQEHYDQILWRYYFGVCIGNTDMHAGNISFYCEGQRLLGLAPVYDMLPMSLAPVNEQVLAKPTLSAPILPPHEQRYWDSAKETARKFWQALTVHKGIGPDLKIIATSWLELLR